MNSDLHLKTFWDLIPNSNQVKNENQQKSEQV